MFSSMGRSRSDKIFSLKFCRGGGGGSGGRYPLNLFFFSDPFFLNFYIFIYIFFCYIYSFFFILTKK